MTRRQLILVSSYAAWCVQVGRSSHSSVVVAGKLYVLGEQQKKTHFYVASSVAHVNDFIAMRFKCG